MKTTVEISDSLLRQAKAFARRNGTTVRALVEAGLHAVLKEQRGSSRFQLRDESFVGQGLTESARGQGWDSLRDSIYEGRGS